MNDYNALTVLLTDLSHAQNLIIQCFMWLYGYSIFNLDNFTDCRGYKT